MKPKLTLIISALWLLSIAVNAQDFNEVIKAVAHDRAEADLFGISLSISGNFAIVGAPYEDEDAGGGNTLNDAGSAYIFERDGNGNWNEVQKIVASDRAVQDYFGHSVCISGNYVLVGAPWEDEDTGGGNTISYAGSAYIFERDGSGNWNEVQKIVASDRAFEDYFGFPVSISGKYAIVGAYYEDEDAGGGNPLDGAGSAYIFERDGSGNWNEVQKIVASDRAEGDYFAYSVSISGNYVLVGAPWEDEDAGGGNTLNNAGSAYIFERDGSGNWNEVQKIVASDRAAVDQFCASVDISGNYVLVGAYGEDEDAGGGNTLSYAGSAYIFVRDGSGNWNEVQKIVAPDRDVEDFFGISLSISGNYAIVGAVSEDEDAGGVNTLESAGSAYIFERDGSGNWNEVQKIVASDRAVDDYFGRSVRISGDYVLVGTYNEDEDAGGLNTLDNSGSAYIFESCTPGGASDPDNIIANGDFEDCILSPWYVYVADYLGATANAVLIDGECQVSGITLTSDPLAWDIQLNQSLTPSQLSRLETSATYELTFDARAETDDRQCRVAFEQDEDPWNNLLSETFIMNTEPASYSYEFEMSTVYTVMKLSFQPGLESTSFTIDNVRLVKKAGNPVVDQSKENAIRIMPNPARDYIQVAAAIGSRIRLYNSLGVLVLEFILQSEHTELDVSDITRGVYLVEIDHGSQTTREKVVVQ